MSFSQLGYSQFLSGSQEVYGGDRAGLGRDGGADGGVNQAATAAAVSSMLGMYGNPWAAQNYSAFLPYSGADLALISQMNPQYDLKDSPGAHPGGLAVHASAGFYPYGQYGYGDPNRAKAATRETTSTLKAWLQEHQKNPYPTKGEKIMLAIITKMTLTQVSTWFANARRRLKKENKVTWGRSAEDRDGRIFSSDNEDEPEKHGSEDEEEEEIDLESIDIDKVEENPGDQREVEGEGKLAARDASDSGSLESQRTMSVKALRSTEGPISLIKAPVGPCKNAVDLSPNAPVCQRPPQNKPKIWSLAETATSPDSSIKPSPDVSIPHQATIPSHHPALLPGHGIYTCQIGKQLHNWANAAFLSANSLLGVRSLLGAANPAGHHMPLHGALNHQDARLTQASGASCTEEESGDESLESFSPKRDDDVNIRRSGSPKSPFQLITDRSHHGTVQRALSTISTI
ncbi:iroquois-class homeodomain protein irx-1-like [Salvelinus namaycush]|uniref:Iroquois-class homeodomain protein irx-1-like n=1 Tax=Salvelinus namaycush TaxID=8040 RepID=A0A8U0PRA6_SALNM|nr:iroquois-class homeodomain protein irx-1-like [Salvelinus namaycush]